jgi:demethylmenaquinone methyltransferase/2-methoxy-6-polyprenyl-1,4-benzoquinol methylase
MTATSQDLDATRAFYDRISAVYDALADRDERHARELGLTLLGAQPGERILEVGFGTGTSLVSLAAAIGASGHVSGVDISPGMKAVASERVHSASPAVPVDLLVTAVPPIPFDDRTFDGIFAAFTLELFPDDTIPVILAEARRTLRAGGRLVVVAMDIGTDEQRRAAAERVYTWLHRHFPHIVDCRPIDVERRLAESGFAVARVERLEIWGLAVAACLAR